MCFIYFCYYICIFLLIKCEERSQINCWYTLTQLSIAVLFLERFCLISDSAGSLMIISYLDSVLFSFRFYDFVWKYLFCCRNYITYFEKIYLVQDWILLVIYLGKPNGPSRRIGCYIKIPAYKWGLYTDILSYWTSSLDVYFACVKLCPLLFSSI